MNNIRNFLILILTVFTLNGCFSVDSECCDFIDSYSINDSLHVERYRTFCAGVFGETVTYCLTDSTNFRKSIGSKDEHGNVQIAEKNGVINFILTETKFIQDTLDLKRNILSNLNRSNTYIPGDTNCLPLFSKEKLPCTHFSHLYSRELEHGFFLRTDQYQCNGEYINAVSLTDSIEINILIGFQKPGGSPSYQINFVTNNEINVYQFDSHRAYDTLLVNAVTINTLKKEKLTGFCKE